MHSAGNHHERALVLDMSSAFSLVPSDNLTDQIPDWLSCGTQITYSVLGSACGHCPQHMDFLHLNVYCSTISHGQLHSENGQGKPASSDNMACQTYQNPWLPQSNRWSGRREVVD